MQKNPMNENRKEKSMSGRTTPMNLNQGKNKKMRKTHRSVCDNGIQKRTTLDRDGVQMRDRSQRMTSNLKEKIMNLSQLNKRDPRIRTLLDRSTSDK